MHTHTHIHTYTHTHIHAYTYTHMHTCMHTFIHTNTRRRTRTHPHFCKRPSVKGRRINYVICPEMSGLFCKKKPSNLGSLLSGEPTKGSDPIARANCWGYGVAILSIGFLNLIGLQIVNTPPHRQIVGNPTISNNWCGKPHFLWGAYVTKTRTRLCRVGQSRKSAPNFRARVQEENCKDTVADGLGGLCHHETLP